MWKDQASIFLRKLYLSFLDYCVKPCIHAIEGVTIKQNEINLNGCFMTMIALISYIKDVGVAGGCWPYNIVSN